MIRRHPFVLLAILAAVLFAVAACGGDDEETGAEPPPPAEAPPAEEPPAEEPPAEEPPAEGGASEIQLAADAGGALAYDQSSLEASAGTVSIVLTNESPVPHNVAIEAGDGTVVVEGEIFQGGGTRTTTADLEAGDYVFFCSVPGHRDAGMEGTLAVSG